MRICTESPFTASNVDRKSIFFVDPAFHYSFAIPDEFVGWVGARACTWTSFTLRSFYFQMT